MGLGYLLSRIQLPITCYYLFTYLLVSTCAIWRNLPTGKDSAQFETLLYFTLPTQRQTHMHRQTWLTVSPENIVIEASTLY